LAKLYYWELATKWVAGRMLAGRSSASFFEVRAVGSSRHRYSKAEQAQENIENIQS
jgi:hypothetical protein